MMDRANTEEISIAGLKIRFYSGSHSIGGSQILLIGQQHSIFLDFGYNFKIAGQYLEEYIQPREFNAIQDRLKLKILPFIPIENYRSDYLELNRGRIKKVLEISNPIPKISHVILSHAHSDHMGQIKYLAEDIKIVCSNITKTVLEYFDEINTSNSNFTGVIKFKKKFQEDSLGKRIKKSAEEQSREIITVKSGERVKINNEFQITLYETDHSLPGAAGFFIEYLPTGEKVVYTGDIRQHGPMVKKVEKFIQDATKFQPTALITEGTWLGHSLTTEIKAEDEKEGEFNVEELLKETISKINKTTDNKLIFIEYSTRDMYRTASIFRATELSNRILVLEAKTFLLLQRCIEAKMAGLDNVDLSKIRIYLPRKGWGIYDKRDYSSDKALRLCCPNINYDTNTKVKQYEKINLKDPRLIQATEIHENPHKYVMQISYYRFQELFDIRPPPNSFYILSRSEIKDPESLVSAEKASNWMKLFDIPKENIIKIHCSGHIHKPELIKMVNTINPKIVFPIHSENPNIPNLNPDIIQIEANSEVEYQLGNILNK
jgi:ribonuclease J